VTFTATVTNTSGVGGTPTGSVEFYDLSTNTKLGAGTALTGSGNTVTFTFQIATLTAGPHQIEAVYSGSAAFQGTSGALNQTINQATPTISVIGYTLYYDGNPHMATGTATGVFGESVAGLNLNNTTHTSASTSAFNDSWTFTDPNGNYQTETGTVQDVIKQAGATITASNASKVYGTTLTFKGTEFIASGLFASDSVTSVTLACSGTRASALVGSYPITPSGAVGTGLSNYTFAYDPGTLLVTELAESVFVLDPTASGALTVSGSAQLKVPGNLIVDSSSASALTTSGTASVTATKIQVTGNYKKASGTTISPAPVTGVTAVPDPLGGPAGPNPKGMPYFGVKNYTSGTTTIPPGIYKSITVSNSAKVLLASGIYVIQGGGLTVSGNASIGTSGGGVLIVNAGSNYPTIGGSQTYGGITLSNSASISLSPYTTTGTYANLEIFQTTDNKQAMTFSGSATGSLTGTIYAPAAALLVSNSAVVQGALIVDTLTVSGAAVTKPATPGVSFLAAVAPAAVPTGSAVGAVAAPAAVPQGPLGWLATPPQAAAGTGSGASATGGPNVVMSAPALTPPPAAPPRVVTRLETRPRHRHSSWFHDSELLSDLAAGLIEGRRHRIRQSATRLSKARA
jgi:hypothetical protein